jgi:hypothetical protein
MVEEFHQNDIENLFRDYCEKMDPKAYLENEKEIVNMLIKAVDQFRVTQQERAKRFVLIYEYLDNFDPQKIYDEIRVMETKSQVLDHFHNVTAEFRSLCEDGDDVWIRHEKYMEEFFDSVKPGATCSKFRREWYQKHSTIFEFGRIFNLKQDHIVDTSDMGDY